MSLTPTFNEEVQLCGWSDSHTSGPIVKFWLADREQLRIFEGLTTRKGNMAGHRFAMCLVEIGADDKPVAPVTTDGHKRIGPLLEVGMKTAGFPPGLTGLAVRWCLDETFQTWITVTHPNESAYCFGSPESKTPEGLAKLIICSLCQVTSRKALDTDPEAGLKFNTNIREPFARYLQERGLDD